MDIFKRDRSQFEKEFPCWKIEAIRLLMPLRYLVSGGVSLRLLAPLWSYPLWVGLERLFIPWLDKWAMFSQITLGESPFKNGVKLSVSAKHKTKAFAARQLPRRQYG